MIPEPLARRLTLRFSTLRNAPSDVEGMEELTRALQRYAVNDEHALKIVNKWIENERSWPTPRDIADMAQSLPASRCGADPDAKCRWCAGSGWEPIYILHTHEFINETHYKTKERFPYDKAQYERLARQIDWKKQAIYEHVQRCTHCGYGKELNRVYNERNPNQRQKSVPEMDEETVRILPREPEVVVPPSPGAEKKRVQSHPPPLPMNWKRITDEDVDRVVEANRKAKETGAEETPDNGDKDNTESA